MGDGSTIGIDDEGGFVVPTAVPAGPGLATEEEEDSEPCIGTNPNEGVDG